MKNAIICLFLALAACAPSDPIQTKAAGENDRPLARIERDTSPLLGQPVRGGPGGIEEFVPGEGWVSQ